MSFEIAYVTVKKRTFYEHTVPVKCVIIIQIETTPVIYNISHTNISDSVDRNTFYAVYHLL